MSVSINGTGGLTFNDASVQNTAATGFGFKNRLFNGNMAIDQRNAGAAQNSLANTGVYLVDRWSYNANQSGKFNSQQNAGSVTPPAGFSNYLGLTSTSAYSVLTGDYFTLNQRIEGFNFADMSWGTASASSITLSFKVYSSLTGTFGGSLVNAGFTRSYPFTYTVSAANTWTTVSVTIAGDTSGTWVGATNGIGVYVYFGLGAGATYSGTAGSWSGAAYLTATGAISVVGTSGATFYITGVQLEKGSTATSFDFRSYGTELALCQRYYYKNSCSSATSQVAALGFQQAALTTSVITAYPAVSMRSSPTIGFANLSVGDYTSWVGAVSSITGQYGSPFTSAVQVTHASGGAAYRPCVLFANTTAGYLDFSAEL
jgi:hypothetical protein